MTLLETVAVAIGLAMDAFAVSLGAGGAGRAMAPRAPLRLSFHFGLFQFLMPVAGWFLGTQIVGYLGAFDHWVAAGLLAFVGVRMIRAGLDWGGDAWTGDPSRGCALVILSVATSIDALAVGLTLAMLGTEIWFPAVVIGVVAGVLSLAGFGLGRRLGRALGKRMEVAGGMLLILIGLRILAAHLGA